MTVQGPFEDALSDLRLQGSVLLNERYARPWAIDIPDASAVRSMLGAESNTFAIPFHLVRRGGFRLHIAGHRPLDVNCHEVALCVSGESHRMSDGNCRTAIPLAEIVAGHASSRKGESTVETTELVCGVVVLRAAPLNPLLGALPPVLIVPVMGQHADPLLAQAASMLAEAVSRKSGAGSFVCARLVEIFFAEAIHACARGAINLDRGWFRALADPKLAQALAFVHARPGDELSVARLAAVAALSPSRFAARFREAMGQSVQAYVARWRMNIACRQLAHADQTIADTAALVGYESVPSFARAFRAVVGMPPGQWRRQQWAR